MVRGLGSGGATGDSGGGEPDRNKELEHPGICECPAKSVGNSGALELSGDEELGHSSSVIGGATPSEILYPLKSSLAGL